MVMAVNNAALLGGQAVVDTSGWADQFRDGQKLRQEYEGRQQQKALNELMGIEDFNERITKARTHKYAGALVPELQKYEEARQKAALENLDASATIGKTYGETSKLNAESGKIGAETTGLVRENTAGIQNDISALAVTQDPKLFALGLGEMTRQGLITPERTDMMIKMLVSDPQNAAKVMQSMVMANPALATLFKPEGKVLDGKDAAYMYSTNGFTGEANEPTSKINYGVSATDQMKDDTSRANNQYTVDAGERNSARSLQGTQYVADTNYAGKVYGADSTAQTAQLKLDQDGRLAWEGVRQKQQELDNPRSNRKQIPVSAKKEMDKLYTNLVSNARTLKENNKWLDRLRSGELKLSSSENFKNTFAGRTGMTSVGSNPKDFAEFNAYIKDLANKALRLNAGVQTDADYNRQLEAIVSGNGLPKDNGIAVALLNRIHKDFDSQNKAAYANFASYKKEYAGVDIPAYGSNRKTTNANSGGGNSKSASIIAGSLGGK